MQLNCRNPQYSISLETNNHQHKVFLFSERKQRKSKWKKKYESGKTEAEVHMGCQTTLQFFRYQYSSRLGFCVHKQRVTKENATYLP